MRDGIRTRSNRSRSSGCERDAESVSEKACSGCPTAQRQLDLAGGAGHEQYLQD